MSPGRDMGLGLSSGGGGAPDPTLSDEAGKNGAPGVVERRTSAAKVGL